jgi:hypothetical protein
MVFDPIEVYEIFDEIAAIVDDDFANGWRTVSKGDASDRQPGRGRRGYLFDHAPCCCIWPDRTATPTWSQRSRRRAEGVIFWYKFCEPAPSTGPSWQPSQAGGSRHDWRWSFHAQLRCRADHIRRSAKF